MNEHPMMPYKILGHWDRIDQFKRYGYAWPVEVDIWITDRCTHKCPNCAGYRSGANDLATASVRKFLGEFAMTKGKAITICGGGEPLLHPGVPEIIDRCAELTLDCALVSNGDVWRDDVCHAILQSGSWCRVSLDAFDEASHEQMHGVKGRFSEVTANVARYAECKRAAESPCLIGVSYLTCAVTRPGIAPTAKLVHELGADYIQFRPMYGDFEDVSKEIAEAQQYTRQGFRVLASTAKYDRLTNGRRYGKCYGHWFGAVLKTNGRFGVCCCDGIREFGSLSQGWMNSWLSEEHRQAIDSIDLDNCVPVCRWNGANEVLWRVMHEAEHPNFI